MFFKRRRQIFIFLLANIVTISANGQSYADRENFYTGVGLPEDNEDEPLHTEYYDWSQDQDVMEIRRWNVEEYPHPQLTPRYCNRLSASNVCDPDGILSVNQANNLDAIIRKLFNETSCICEGCSPNDGGIQVGIALLKNTFQPYLEHRAKVIRSFSRNLRSKWHLGECEDDILIVVATNDRQSYTDVGSSASRYISKEEAYRIFLQNKSYFSKGEYYEGLREMLQAYQEAMKDFVKPQEDSEVNVALLSGIVVIIVIVLCIILLFAVFIYKRKRDLRPPATKTLRRNETSSSSWRRKDIKMLLSSFVSTSDTYKPCKTQEEIRDSDQNLATKGQEDDEVLNLELAEPEPKTTDASLNTADNDGTSTTSVNKDNAAEAQVHHIDNSQIGEQSQQQNGTNEVQNPNNNHNKFQTFAPKLQPHQTDL